MKKPFDDYLKKLEDFINVANIMINIIHNEDNDYEFALPEDLYALIGRPTAETTEEDGEPRYVIDASSFDVTTSILESSGRTATQMLMAYQTEVLDSLQSAIAIYKSGQFSAKGAMTFVEMIYAGAVLTNYKTVHALSQITDVGVTDDQLAELETMVEELAANTLELAKNTDLNDDALVKNYEDTIRQMKQTLNRQSKSLGHEITNTQKTKDLLDTEQQLRQRDQKELAELRELLFTLNDEEEEPQEENISFPYYTKKTIYVLGGRPAWMSQMKELLPNLRYLSSDQNIKLTDKLLNADEVWFQWRALSHSQFYTATQIIDRYHIPVFYFRHKSAKNCATQFVHASIDKNIHPVR